MMPPLTRGPTLPILAQVDLRRTSLPAYAVAAVLLHAAIILLFYTGTRPRSPQMPAAIEVELVDQAAQRKGADASSPAQQSRPQPAPPAGPGTQSPAAPSPPPTRALPAVHLADGAEDREALKVTGDNIVAARPDARFHNLPPAYPPEATRDGAQGDVLLVVHVTASGVASSVDVRGSSGYPSLDQAAKDAVALWRFLPARNAGHPVPFDFVLNTRFRLGETP